MRLFCLIFLMWQTAAAAQNYPLYDSIAVNDYADLLPPQDEADLTQRLLALKAETGVEMTLLTLGAQAAFAPEQSLEEFVTGVFDTWGIGDPELNDGVLVLVLRTDRAMRIELGAGYGRDWDLAAQRVVDQRFLPFFREDKYAEGIAEGMDAVIEDIVLPFKGGKASPVRAINGQEFLAILGGVIAGSIAILVVIVRVFKTMVRRFRKCPQCGQGGLNKTRIVTSSASTVADGRGINRFHCNFCDYSADRAFTISKVQTSSNGSSGSGFSGGRSGGGGASGRW